MFRAALLIAVLAFSAIAASDAQAQFGISSTFQYQNGPAYAVPYGIPNYRYGNRYQSYYSAPYRSPAYPYGTSYLGPTYYPNYRYSVPRVRVYRTPANSSTFGGAHSSQYFGDPHASQYFPR